MPNEVVLRKLAFIRYLYTVAVEQSKNSEPLSAASILTFHDSVELFLQLVCDEYNINSNDFVFMKYWDEISKKSPNGIGLSQKEPMRILNDRRVQLKHKGNIPSKFEVESARFNATSFFQENTSLIFGIGFDNISMTNFVQYIPARDNLNQATEFMDKGELENALARIAIAFASIIDDYENRKTSKYGKSPFFFGTSFTFLDSFFMKISDNKMKEFVDKVKDSIEPMQEAMKILTLGLDYRRYTKFRLLAPRVLKSFNGYNLSSFNRERSLTVEECRFCHDFVIESAIRVQDFDFNT
jgi:hypothetical protein